MGGGKGRGFLLLAGCLLLGAAAARAQTLATVGGTGASGLPVPESIIKAAKSYLGVPYVHGGETRSGLDCSGLVYRVFRDILGMDLPRGVDALYRAGTAAGSPLHLGDLVFFDTDEKAAIANPTHVGVYAGGGRFVHAASEGARTGVTVSSLSTPYFRARFLGARRVFPWRAPVLSLTVTDEHVRSD
jgi:cell wall-associated NlpC family hydrolase